MYNYVRMCMYVSQTTDACKRQQRSSLHALYILRAAFTHRTQCLSQTPQSWGLATPVSLRKENKENNPWGGCTYPEDALDKEDWLYTPPQSLDLVSKRLPQVLSPARPSTVTPRLPWRESQVRHLASPARGNGHTQTNIIP